MLKKLTIPTILFLTSIAIQGRTQTPELLKDIRSINNSSNINFVANLGALTIFSATDGIHGQEMWRTDGTEAGTFMLKDIAPGPGNGITGDLFGSHVLNGMVYFSLPGAIWRTDGSMEGTQIVSSAASLPDFRNNFSVVYNNTILFSARVSGTSRRELWRTDGTEAGTFVLKEIGPTVSGGSYPRNFMVANGLAFFPATSTAGGNELWKTDGTNAGTLQVKDINPETASSSPTGLTAIGNTLYFAATSLAKGTELWKTDGSDAGTVMVKDINPEAANGSPANLTALGNALYFSANDGANGSELWKSDGTEVGTILLKEIRPEALGSSATSFFRVGNLIIFKADDGTTGLEFWRTDGTADGTFLLKDIWSGLSSSTQFVPFNPIVAGSNMFFIANNGSIGDELWATDGTTDGTMLMKDFNPGLSGASYGNFVAIGSNIYFTVTNPPANTISLWQSNGTPEGTVALPSSLFPETSALSTLWLTTNNELLSRTFVNAISNLELWKTTLQPGGSALVKDINIITSGSLPNHLTVVGNLAFFSANDGGGATLWKTDGTTAGTVMVVPAGMGTVPGSPNNLLAVGNFLYFSATTASAGRELWRSDGTAAGTYMIKDVNPGSVGTCEDLCEVNGIVYYRGTTTTAGIGSGLELFKSDGTAEGTGLVKDINPGVGSSQPQFFVNLNGTLIFSAAGSMLNSVQHTNFELWKSNGTEAGTIRIRDINPGLANSNPQFLVAMNGAVYFTANNGINGIEFWKTDGSEAGTIMLKDINLNAASSTPQNLYAYNGFVYFAANNGLNGNELWRTDGTTDGTILFKDIYPGNLNGAPARSNPTNFTSVGNILFFTAESTSAGGSELWKSDGTNAGTIMVKDINSVPAGSGPQYLTPYGNKIYFTANGGASTNIELYVSDGTADGTSMLGEIIPGSQTALPEQLVILGDKLLFFAQTMEYGMEIWKMNLSSSPALLTWTGNTSTSWEDASNWEPAAVPGSNTEVIIPSGRPRYPTLNVSTTVRKLSVGNGASVQVKNNLVLIVLE